MQETITAPAKPPVSQNGSTQIQPQLVPSALNKLLEGNTPFVIWLIFFAIGGGLLALYYARIGYLPDIEWKAVLIYLFIGSVVGGVIGLLLTMSVYLPGVIWSETIVFDPCLRFSYAPPVNKQSGTTPNRQLCLRSILKYLGVPFLFALLLSHIALLAGKVAYWIIAAGLLLLTFFSMRILLRYRLRDNRTQKLWSYFWSTLKRAKPEHNSADAIVVDRHVFKLSSAFTLSVLLNQISMYVIYWLSGSPAERGTFVILTLLCTAGVWIASHVVAMRHRQNSRQALAASLIAAALLLFTADNFSSLSMKLMNHYGIGYNQKANLLMTDHGGEIVNALGVKPCSKLQLCDVEILSKVGDQYYIRVGADYLTLPKSDVIAIRLQK